MKSSKERFSFINPSPLIGGTLSNLLKLVRRHRISVKYWSKLVLPLITSILSIPFRFIDRIRYRHVGDNISVTPIFIIGHWRSGTTFLHNLMCQDPQFGFLTTYQAVFPGMMWIRHVLKRILSPFMVKKRPGDDIEMHFDNPQEDEFAMNNLTEHSYYHFMYFPLDYNWLYEYYVRFKVSDKIKSTWQTEYDHLLKKTAVIAGKSGLVLKNPVNTGRIKLLHEMYPDAKFIFIHRNPLDVYRSTKKFYEILFKSLELQNTDLIMQKELILDVYKKIMKDYLDQRKYIPSEQLVEVSYESLVDNPMNTMKEIYSQLALGPFEQAEPGLKAYLSDIEKSKSEKIVATEDESEIVRKEWEFAFEKWGYNIK